MRPLVPPHIETLQPYVPGKPIEETEREYGIIGAIKVASNENPLGPSLLALEALQFAAKRVNLYPDGSSYYLLKKLSSFLQVRADELFVGNGSNEIIELLVRTFTTATDEALICKGSFLMYKVALQSHGRAFTEVPMQPGYRYDLRAMSDRITPRTRIIFLANPDNPTGTAFSRSEFESFLRRVPDDCFVALDEAYFEYVDWPEYPNGLDYFRAHPNLIVLRTYSKIYGLAGVRLGYAIMQRHLTEYLNRTRLPFNLSSLAQAAGVAAVDDVEHVRNTREATHRGLRYLVSELRSLGLAVPDSHANFVFADFGRPAAPIYEELLRRGIITRPIPAYGFPNALRISVGLSAHNERLVDALKEVLGGKA
jgi:histidinol-phosphate aminotransferase